jgi:hypothetical protein
MPTSNEYRQMRQILSEPMHAKLLYHRNGFPRRRIIEPLEDFCKSTKNRDLQANIHYALGCFLIKNAYGKSIRTQQKYTKWGNTHLREALETENLSLRRKTHTVEYLEQ